MDDFFFIFFCVLVVYCCRMIILGFVFFLVRLFYHTCVNILSLSPSIKMIIQSDTGVYIRTFWQCIDFVHISES